MKSKNITRSLGFVALAAAMTACGPGGNNPGIQYAPEMYESIPYEAFKQVRDSVTPFKNGLTMQVPPLGTISTDGHPEGWVFAKGEAKEIKNSEELKAYPNPIPTTEASLAEGKELYERFCAVCHGKKGAGNGKVAEHDAINPNPYDSGDIKNYTASQIYHTIMYGEGVMGSYSSQLDHDERWKVVQYVQTLQGKATLLEKAPEFHLSDVNYEEMEVGNRYQLTQVYFNSGDTVLLEQSRDLLGELSELLTQYPTMEMEIGGHTDTDGDAAANQLLSQKRANVVMAYIVSRGINPAQVKAKGYGATEPIAANDTPENKQLNRRTEIRVLHK